MSTPIHLGWFNSFVTDDWYAADHDPSTPWNGRFHIELAKKLEEAKFDFIFFEDTLMVSDAFGGSREHALALGTVGPKHDPVPLVAAIASHTEKLGVFSTMSTTFYPPYLLARLTATLDHLSGGRFGWNVVTSAEDLAAQNFGLDKIPAHDERYEMADEYVNLIEQLWDSWEEGAYIADQEKQVFVDHTKVHEINFKGKYYASRGPLNVIRPPQGHPVLAQAGSSPRGRDFAAKYGELILSQGGNVEKMKEHRDDVRARAAALGRNPDHLKMMFIASPVVAETREEALAKYEAWTSNDLALKKRLEMISALTEIDFAQFHLDEPLPEDLTTDGNQGVLKHFMRTGGTLRDMLIADNEPGPFIGSAAEVAKAMAEQIEAVGGDGYLIYSPQTYLDSTYVDDITQLLVPELRKRGVFREDYQHSQLRSTLREY